MKYFAIFEKNVKRIFQLQWKIGNISDIFLQYSVLCERSFVHGIDCAGVIRHGSVMHRYKWAPERLHTPFFKQVGTREFSTKLKVHNQLSTIQLHTSETGHRVDSARANLRTVSINHKHNCAPYRLSTSTTVHHVYYSCANLSKSLLSAFSHILYLFSFYRGVNRCVIACRA